MDLDPTVNFLDRPDESRTLLLEFLDQFEEIESRWQNVYESGTSMLIIHSARLQREILAHNENVLSDNTISQSTLVAALLRCLVVSHDIADVDSNWSRNTVIPSSAVHVIRHEGHYDYWGLVPSLTVRRIRGSHRRREENQMRRYPRGLPAILEKAIGVIQRIMFGRRPHDVPCLIYSLILLALIAQALQPIAEFMTPVDEAGQEVKESLRTLCDLYLFCFGSLHPFAEPYDRAMYAVMVDNDRIAVRHFHILNSLWEQAGKTVL